MFGETDIMRKQLTTKDMGKYLVLRLSFSGVAPDENVKTNFRDYINGKVLDFSEKYVEAGLLNSPITFDPEFEGLFGLTIKDVEHDRQSVLAAAH